ncbi:MAG: hypothetical protein F9K36_02700 [Burkholderiaceae bacterium]|nr:MAG: hypothetical protein F9K36_02700 [Burkholderiaceae bacterium]
MTDAGTPLARDALAKAAARRLGVRRLGKQIAASMDDAIRRAVRRGIAENGGPGLQLAVRQIDGYDRKHVEGQLVAALRAQRRWVARSDVPTVLARWLGFARTGARIAETTESLLRRLARAGTVEVARDAVRVAKS